MIWHGHNTEVLDENPEDPSRHVAPILPPGYQGQRHCCPAGEMSFLPQLKSHIVRAQFTMWIENINMKQ